MGHRLHIHQSGSARDAKAYFEQALSKADYFIRGQELVGQWQGRGAALLGLQGQVTKQAFEALCDNRRPEGQGTLTQRAKTNHRPGYDINFRCPKSVSVVQACTGDDRILDAFRGAVRDTMAQMEADMRTRVRTGGQDADRVTGNMVWTEFMHFTARPVDGVPDPHLHMHCYTFNATFDPEEQRWKAGQFGELKRQAPYYEAVFDATLAKRLHGLGYGIAKTPDGWEIAGVPAAVVGKFSRRLAQIDAMAEGKGVTNPLGKRGFSATTRAGKDESATLDELQAVWRERLTDGERAALAGLRGRSGQQAITPTEAMDYALAQVFERQSVASDRRVLTEALRHGVGAVDLEAVQAELARPEVIARDKDGERWLTTREVLAEERAMLGFARSGRGVCDALASEPYDGTATRLNAEQQAAVRHVLASHDRVMVIAGGAGVGKTALMQEAVSRIEAAGKRVMTVAPSSEAARDVLRGEGFAEADTVQRLLVDTRMQARLQGQVLWVDEAGLLSSRDMQRLFTIAEAQQARVILSGDTGQHSAVARGEALRLLQDQAGITPARVTQILRQQDPTYRDAVDAFRQGDLEQGFAALDALGAVRELPDEARYAQLARDYVATLQSRNRRGERKTALVVSPTHREGEDATGYIRTALRAEGMLGPEERRVTGLRNLSWTEAERGDGRKYQPGQVVQFHQNGKGGVTRGARFEVVGQDEAGRVQIRDGQGQASALRLDEARKFSVFEPFALGLAVGETIRITGNGHTKEHKRLNTGALYTVQGFTTQGDLTLSNGWVVPRDYGHLTHGYVTTSHASQGKTVDQVLIAQSAASCAAASREQWYVSISRGREGVTVYTDDREALREMVRDSHRRLAATELMQQTAAPEPDRDARMQRQGEWLARLGTTIRAYASRGREIVAGYGRAVVEQLTSRGMEYGN